MCGWTERYSRPCMTRITVSEALERARAWFGLPQAAEGEVSLVHRLDGGADYYLVSLRDGNRTAAVANVDAATGDIRESAKIGNGSSPIQITAERAAKISGVRAVKTVELVWQPCRATRSPLYPVWRVSGDIVVYVDQQGKVWRDLK
jgi:hypothetical protein